MDTEKVYMAGVNMLSDIGDMLHQTSAEKGVRAIHDREGFQSESQAFAAAAREYVDTMKKADRHLHALRKMFTEE